MAELVKQPVEVEGYLQGVRMLLGLQPRCLMQRTRTQHFVLGRAENGVC